VTSSIYRTPLQAFAATLAAEAQGFVRKGIARTPSRRGDPGRTGHPAIRPNAIGEQGPAAGESIASFVSYGMDCDAIFAGLRNTETIRDKIVVRIYIYYQNI
jgi:hypothetical protein